MLFSEIENSIVSTLIIPTRRKTLNINSHVPIITPKFNEEQLSPLHLLYQEKENDITNEQDFNLSTNSSSSKTSSNSCKFNEINEVDTSEEKQTSSSNSIIKTTKTPIQKRNSILNQLEKKRKCTFE